MTVDFTEEQMKAVAILANHVEGFATEPETLTKAITDADKLWNKMFSVVKRGN